MEDINKKKDIFIIKIFDLCGTKTELQFEKRNKNKELVYFDKDEEIIIKTGKDLIDLIDKNNIYKILYKKRNITIKKNEKIDKIISKYEDKKGNNSAGLVIIPKNPNEDKDEEDEEETINIFIQTPLNTNDNKCKIQINEDACLLDLKILLSKQFNVNIIDQKIKFKEEELKDDKEKIKKYGILDNCTIYMEEIKKETNPEIVNAIKKSYINLDAKEREKCFLEVMNKPELKGLFRVFKINEKLNNPEIKSLMFDNKYDKYFEKYFKDRLNLLFDQDVLNTALLLKYYIDNDINI